MATICVKPEKDGYEVRDAAEWDGNHGAFCIGCDFSGNVDQFEVVEPEIDAINP
jgi:regulator of RNase E activity RraB